MGVMAPRSSSPGEDGNPLRGDGRPPDQRATKTPSYARPIMYFAVTDSELYSQGSGRG